MLISPFSPRKYTIYYSYFKIISENNYLCRYKGEERLARQRRLLWLPKLPSHYHSQSMYHTPVLLNPSVDLLNINPAGTYVDATFGGGGHSREILSRLDKKGRLYSFDQDKDTLANAIDDKRFTLINNNFKFLRGCLRAEGVESVDGILADYGVSSHHFDTPERGFSFRFDAPLDMRMNQSADQTAANVINEYDDARLAHIFGEYGELERPFRIANAIVAARENTPVLTIGELLEVVDKVTPRGGESKFRAKLFQALRIEVNGEMEALEMMLEQSLKILKPGGRLSVITYHSLEDRLVKNFMKTGTFNGKVQKDFYGNISTPFELVTRKAVEPSEAEIAENSRSRSARLRVATKL